MSKLILDYPSVTGRTADERVAQLERHLYTMTEKLNLADWSAGTILKEITQAVDAEKSPAAAGETQAKLQEYAAIKDLVIKTADYAAKYSEGFQLNLRGSYVAVSDFGKYWQEATMEIDGNEFGIRQLYEYAEGVNNKFTVNSQQYVKTGLLYYADDTGLPVYGVGVGNIATTVTDENDEIVYRSDSQMMAVTADRLSFWDHGTEVAYLTQKKMYFPAGTLEAYSAKLSGTLTAAAGSQIGPWYVSSGSISYAFSGSTPGSWGAGNTLYFGTSGLSVRDKFTVDAGGYLKATGAEITGKITATSLDVTNAYITGLSADAITTGSFSADRISGGTIDCNYINVINLSASAITTGTLEGIIVESYASAGYTGSTVKMVSGSLSIGYTSGGYSEAGYLWYDNESRVYLGSNRGYTLKLESGANMSIDARQYGGIFIGQTNRGQSVHIGSSGNPVDLYVNGNLITFSGGSVGYVPE